MFLQSTLAHTAGFRAQLVSKDEEEDNDSDEEEEKDKERRKEGGGPGDGGPEKEGDDKTERFGGALPSDPTLPVAPTGTYRPTCTAQHAPPCMHNAVQLACSATHPSHSGLLIINCPHFPPHLHLFSECPLCPFTTAMCSLPLSLIISQRGPLNPLSLQKKTPTCPHRRHSLLSPPTHPQKSLLPPPLRQVRVGGLSGLSDSHTCPFLLPSVSLPMQV